MRTELNDRPTHVAGAIGAGLRIGLAAVLIALTPLAPAHAQSTDAEKSFFRDAQAMAARHLAEMDALIKRTDKVDLDGTFGPHLLATPGGIAEGRATVGIYRALLRERKALLARVYAESEALFARSPSDSATRWAPRPFGLKKEAVLKIYVELDAVETAYADATDQVLQWCARQRGRIGVKNGEFTFATRRTREDFHALVTKAMAAATRVNESIVALGAATNRPKE